MADVLKVKRREKLGTAHTRRLRRTGEVPATLYGHGEASVSLSVPSAQVWSAVRHGGKLVTLEGDANDSALIRAVQWDTFGKEVLHLDLMRVSASETVETTVTIELKGTAVGVSEGGIIEHVLHDVEIECPAMSIPDKLIVSIADLHLGKAIHASDIKLPEGAKMLTDADALVVHCIAPHVEGEEQAAGEAGVAEPEIIGRKDKDEEEAAEE